MHKIGFFRSIQLKFIIIYILLLLVAVQVIGSYFASELEEELTTNFTRSIDDRIDVLSYYLEEAFNRERTEDGQGPTLIEDVQGIVRDIDTSSDWSLLVVDKQSRVLATNDHNLFDNIGKKISLDSIQRALLVGTEIPDTRYDLENATRVYVNAVPIKDDDENTVGAIYFESSLADVYNQLENINEIFFKGSVLAIVVSALLGILVARAITKPIKEMRSQALTMAKGDFTQKVNIYGQDEIGQLAETFNDLNDRLKHSYATTEEERRKLSSVLSHMSDGVIATDLSGAITLMNDAAGKLIGLDPEESQGEQIIDVLHLDEKVVDLSDLQDTGSMIVDFSDDDQLFLIRANFSMVTDDEDDVTGLITVLSDVTEQEKLEQERREFVSNVSHELRTPLTTMRSYMEALTDGAWKDNEIAPKFMGVVQNETERMIRMVNDLLQLSRMDNQEYRLNKERVEFVQFFDQIIERFEMNRPDGFQFKRELPKQKYYVWIDKDKMTQVLDNIISNAIKYSPNGGTITFRVTKNKYQLRVSIVDEGIGVAFDKLDKIFERFYRADKARTRKLGGTGLGLAISKELVEAHHGKIWASSKEGKGTTVHFNLPLMGNKRRNIS